MNRWLPVALWAAFVALPVLHAYGDDGYRAGGWPFLPLARPAVPTAAVDDWAANPIDHFVLEYLSERGLRPNATADKLALLRRVTFDLTGLPPTVAEQDAFLADGTPNAYETVVDRLLASSRFGERWAQHWLDVVRYAETDGFKSDRLKPNAWRYRDYVIRAFNEDLPYDRFVRQQLAGDELEPGNPDALISTGYLRLCADEDNAANLHQRRQELLDDITDTTGLTFLGLTLGCAQCHDHKYDEILQTDYFRFQAFFAAITERDDAPAADSNGMADYHSQREAWELATADIRRQIEELLQPERDAIAKTSLEKYEASIQQCFLTPDADRTPEQRRIAEMVARRMEFQFEDTLPNKLDQENRARYDDLQKQLSEFDAQRPPAPPHAMAVAELGALAPVTHLLDGGNVDRPLQPLEPGFPEFLTSAPPEKLDCVDQAHTTGRRAQLASWLTQPDHPLTARVIVNRLWQDHFGEGIVATPNDFGFQGGAPSNPELLDWLAAELVAHGWSLKHIHRLMVTSATYCQSSFLGDDDANVQLASTADPANRRLWRARRQRLSGESIRDAMLAITGDLNLRMYGESARPELPDGVSARYAWKPDVQAADRNRRSVYVFAKRNLRFPIFEAFDQPDLNQSCARRPTTVTAPQSLLMLNSKFTREMAVKWAERLIANATDDDALVTQAYREAYGRRPTPDELERGRSFLTEQALFLEPDAQQVESQDGATVAANQTAIQNARQAAVMDFCHAVFNSNEFISID
ncbi:MAG: DUF1549 and DUF1553 domain-containing protein [Planctomycetia bacterium]|nr:DUF1549 and DUF1553 domain-containing protein [Planctomycetia bacterium]